MQGVKSAKIEIANLALLLIPFNTQPLWLWSRIGGWVKISHYIQPSNLSSALSVNKIHSYETRMAIVARDK